jgi:hypothetical protein
MEPRRVPLTTAGCLLVLACTACFAAPEPAPVPGNPKAPVVGENQDPQPAAASPLDAAIADLLAAAPADWTARLEAVLAVGASEPAPALGAAVDRDPAAPGAPAALALLGRLGDLRVVPMLTTHVESRTGLAVDAALALGQLRATAAADVLQRCVDDRFVDATVRTAAACALVRTGRPWSAAPWLVAVVRAGTPAGHVDESALGVPSKTRWALERYLVQRLLLDEGQPDLARRLDPDAPWSTLEQLAGELAAWLATTGA